MTYIRINKYKTKLWYLNGKLHREDGPAVEHANGTKEWWLNDKRHREDGPAIEWVTGTKFWYLNDKLHREDGPAVESYVNGHKEWWLNGQKLSEEEWEQTMTKKDPLYALTNFLKEHGLQSLEEQFKIEVKQHSKYPNLYHLNYNQIESPKHHHIVKICRGIIVDQNNNWKPVCHSFNRFFNYGEEKVDKINWNNATVYEKLDGSLINLWYYDNEWQISTRGSPAGEGNVGSFGFSFKELFWNTWRELEYVMPEPYQQECTYSFELCTKYNRVVVSHTQPRIVLIGIRNTKYNYEIPPYQIHNWEVVTRFDFKNPSDVLTHLETTSPYQQEGFVVCDNQFHRIKMKSSQYVAVHHLVSKINSNRNLLEIIRKNESEEVISHFPEFKQNFDEIQKKYNLLIEKIDKTYSQICHINEMKEFANSAKKYFYSGVLFSLKRYNTPIKSFLKDMNLKTLESWVLEEM